LDGRRQRCKAVERDAEAYDGKPIDDVRGRAKDEVQAYIAHKLKAQITRKLVKQTTMTSVYGVTFVGSREQIMRRLEEANENNRLQQGRGEPHGHILSEEETKQASIYLARHTLNSIGDTFRSAREIQIWRPARGSPSSGSRPSACPSYSLTACAAQSASAPSCRRYTSASTNTPTTCTSPSGATPSRQT
jgi:hypothetical protein